jgi:hypothetical protein
MNGGLGVAWLLWVLYNSRCSDLWYRLYLSPDWASWKKVAVRNQITRQQEEELERGEEKTTFRGLVLGVLGGSQNQNVSCIGVEER